MDEEQLLLICMRKWGFDSQRLIWLEELAELQVVLAKFGRKINNSTRKQIEEEIADVDICLAQMKILFPFWKRFRQEKIKRLASILSKNQREDD